MRIDLRQSLGGLFPLCRALHDRLDAIRREINTPVDGSRKKARP
jgi:hypothetical protein